MNEIQKKWQGAGKTLAEVGEGYLLKKLRRRFAAPDSDSGVLVGIGDDAAILRSVGPGAVISSDALVENVDFSRAWATPADVGQKAAAVNLSDLAAMGAKPRALLLNLILPAGDSAASAMRLVEGVAKVGEAYGAPLVGGDISSTTGPVVVTVTALGEVAPNKALLRNRGHAGDLLVVSGVLGAAAAGLVFLESSKPGFGACKSRQLRPTPRVALGQALGRQGKVVSCADISDGLARDALHVAGPGCGVEIDLECLPLAQGVDSAAALKGRAPWEFALAGGEDFELVLAVGAKDLPAVTALAEDMGEKLTAVGRLFSGRGLRIGGRAGKKITGYEHFR